ncbi:MAG: FtsX-like permease family protein, partial [Candidatus Latescibacterota bacterium]
TEEEERDGRFVAVINETTRSRFFGDEPCIGETIEIDRQRFRVVGVVEDVPIVRDPACAEIWVPISTTRSTTYKKELRGSYEALLLARSRADFPTIRAEFASRLERVEFPDESFNEMRGMPMTRFEVLAREMMWAEPESPPTGKLSLAITGVALLFMLLPTINLVNINISRIFERASEIGVRKAFGASSSRLVAQFVFENVILCVVGGGLSFLLGLAAIEAFNRSGLIAYADFQANYRVFGYAFLLAVFFGCLSGVYPAWRMSRLHPVQALREDTR